MSELGHWRSVLAAAFCIFLSACGTMVPQVGEIWDSGSVGTPGDLEILIKTKLFCELAHAVSYVNGRTAGPDGRQRQLPTRTVATKTGLKELPLYPLPESWGVLMTVQLVVVENTSLSPSASLTPGAPTFILSAGGVLSTEATRTDKFTFFYPVKDLYDYDEECLRPPDGKRSPLLNRGSSLLLESDVGILRWLNNAANVRTSFGISSSNPQQVLSYDTKFNVLTSGTVSPTWKLARVTAQATGNLFSTKRERTHELTLTFGPSSEAKGAKQPGALTLNSALATEFGTAAGIAFKNALSPLAP